MISVISFTYDNATTQTRASHGTITEHHVGIINIQKRIFILSTHFMNRGLSFALTFSRTYATRHPRPKPGSAERPPYRAPDPFLNNPNAIVTSLENDFTFIHRPPPTAPSPFSLTTDPASPLLKASLPAPESDLLPPLIRPSADKVQPSRVSDTVVTKIRYLRHSNPAKYSRGVLAGMYGCTQSFIGSIAALKKSKRTAMIKLQDQKHAEVREKWSEKKSMVRAIRAKRRTFW